MLQSCQCEQAIAKRNPIDSLSSWSLQTLRQHVPTAFKPWHHIIKTVQTMKWQIGGLIRHHQHWTHHWHQSYVIMMSWWHSTIWVTSLAVIVVTQSTSNESILITVDASEGTELLGEVVPVQRLLAAMATGAGDVSVAPTLFTRRRPVHFLQRKIKNIYFFDKSDFFFS